MWDGFSPTVFLMAGCNMGCHFNRFKEAKFSKRNFQFFTKEKERKDEL